MIKLTKEINGKKVVLDLISLGGTVVRAENFKKLKEKGITKDDLKKAGFGIEGDEKIREQSNL